MHWQSGYQPGGGKIRGVKFHEADDRAVLQKSGALYQQTGYHRRKTQKNYCDCEKSNRDEGGAVEGERKKCLQSFLII